MTKNLKRKQISSSDFFQQNNAKQKNFEGVEFLNCDLQEVDLTDFSFVNCKFVGSNLSLIKFNRVEFVDVEFVDSKISGVSFNSKNTSWNFSVCFENCLVRYANFVDVSFKKSKIYTSEVLDCLFQEVDLSFCNCQKTDFNRTVFDKVDFTKADFRGAKNYFIDIFQKPKLKGAKFSRSEASNLLLQIGVDIE